MLLEKDRKIGIDWTIGLPSGWGTYGFNLAVQLYKKGIEPAIFDFSSSAPLSPIAKKFMHRPIAQSAINAGFIEVTGNRDFPFPVLRSMGNDLNFVRSITGTPNIGVVFFENTGISSKVTEELKNTQIITGSTWNTEILQKHGFNKIHFCPQGIDTCIFQTAQGSDIYDDKFIIFSGGKLEYRKGQDIVIAAFREFKKTHPNAMLMTAWYNRWIPSLRSIKFSKYIDGLPQVHSDGSQYIYAWLDANGVPKDSVIDIGEVPNYYMPLMYREADVALFPNRAEGGTNLVAMECMACGVPTILSANTGHLDIISDDNCYVLEKQESFDEPEMEGWGESDVDEIVEKLGKAYADKQEAKKRGLQGAKFMQDWSWSNQIDRLIKVIE